MNTEYVENGRWVEALALMTLPFNFQRSFLMDAQLMDDIFHHAGDKSADVRYSNGKFIFFNDCCLFFPC